MVVVAILSTTILILLILMWLRAGRLVKCRNCRHFAEHYITSLHGEGLFRFGYCQRLIHDCKIVDPDVERVCKDFENRVGEEDLYHAGISKEDAALPLEASGGDKKKRPRNPKVSIFTPGKGENKEDILGLSEGPAPTAPGGERLSTRVGVLGRRYQSRPVPDGKWVMRYHRGRH